MRAKHAEAQLAEQARADAKAGKSPAPNPEQADGYFASIRSYMPSLPFRNWFSSEHDAPVISLGESSKQGASPAASEGSLKHAPEQRKNPIQPEGRLEAKPEPGSHGDGSLSRALSDSSNASRRRAADSEDSSSSGDESRANPHRTLRDKDSRPVAKPNRRSADSLNSPAAGSRSAKNISVAQRSKERGPEGWSLSSVEPRIIRRGLSQAAMDKVETFQQLIRDGFDPSVAADRLGPGTHFKRLKGTDGQFEIRLNQEHRVTFTIDPEEKVVTLLHIGGHTRQ